MVFMPPLMIKYFSMLSLFNKVIANMDDCEVLTPGRVPVKLPVMMDNSEHFAKSLDLRLTGSGFCSGIFELNEKRIVLKPNKPVSRGKREFLRFRDVVFGMID
ncbi:MAG: hypothetical protein PWR32_347, partial [Candidatus Woesearchaeota archaeon]|nr:hypothetical protein [Candidatus Woesearchaeota archaeon]